MATTAAGRPRARRSPKPGAITVATPAEMHALIRDIKLQEREVEKQVLLLGALAGKNIHQNGPPGTGKSLLSREFCKRIGVQGEELRYFEKALHPQMPADALMGAYDIEKLLNESRLERKIEGYMPAAHVSFLDELTRTNGPVADALLPLMNTTERLYEANGRMARSPMLFLVTASNFLPDPTDAHLGAFVSRITLMCEVKFIKADDSFKDLMRHDQARKRGEPSAEATAFVSLAGFQGAQREVRFVDVTKGDFMDEYCRLRRACVGEGLVVDDRRWIELLDVARAAAWLSGRDFCVAQDLAALEAGLWRLQSDIPTVLKLLKEYRSTFEQAAAKHREEAQEGLDTHARLRPILEGTPPSEPVDREVSADLSNAGRALRQIYGRVKDALADAERQQQDAPGLRDLLAELDDWRQWREDNDLPAKW